MKKTSFFSLLVGFITWQSASTLHWVDPVYFPAPFTIAQQAWILAQETEFRNHIFYSLKRLLLGQFIAFPLALFLALMTTLKTTFHDITSPWVSLVYPIPKLALFPFFLIAFGTGDLSKIAMISLSSFFLMYLSFKLGLRRLYESEYYEIIRIYRVSKTRVLWNFFLKGASPEIINGTKLGFGYGLIMMVGSEMAMSKNGLGFYMWNSWDQFRMLDMYACLAWISFFGILSFRLCDWLENKALKRSLEKTL